MLRYRRLLLITAAASVLATAAVVPSPLPVAARGGSTFVSTANEYRSDAGVAPVDLHEAVNQIAKERANQLARARQLGHDMEYVKKRLAQENVCWESFGEIVAYNGLPEDERISRFAYQWYHSTYHREIMLGSAYTHAGGSYTTGSDGYHYAAMIFVRLCRSQRVSAATPFTDVDGTTWEAAITWVYQHGVMVDGCESRRFCPRGELTRGALAQALADGLGLPATDRDFFDDDNSNRFEDGINRLAAAGLTSACRDGEYCPNRSVSRGKLAAALAGALRLPAADRDYFSDDEGNPHEDAINRVAAAGCGDGQYCPASLVRRGRTAVFLRQAFN